MIFRQKFQLLQLDNFILFYQFYPKIVHSQMKHRNKNTYQARKFLDLEKDSGINNILHIVYNNVMYKE